MNPFTRSKPLHFLGKILLLLLLIVPCLFILWPVLDFVRDESMYFSSFQNSAAVADFDGDGDQDVIVVHLRNETWIHITMWMNEGVAFLPGDIEWGPGFNRSGGFVFEGGIFNDVVTGDLDGDLDPDILILTPERLVPFINQGGIQAKESGLFRQHNPITGPETIYQSRNSVLLGDIDGDGKPDAMVAGGCCGYNWSRTTEYPPFSWIWFNGFDAGGQQSERRTAILQAIGDYRLEAADMGDLDGDSQPDIFAVTEEGEPALVLLNDGEGGFNDSGQRLGDAGGLAVSLGDLDGDGDLDALTGTGQGAQVWTNQGGAQQGEAGLFVLSAHELHGDETRQVFLADFDGDRSQDALLAGERQAVLWLNEGQGTFYHSSQTFRYTKRHGLAIGDFNGDGHLDFFAGAYTETPRVWINQGDGTFERLRGSG